MKKFLTWCGLLAVMLALVVPRAGAASASERRALQAADGVLKDHFYELADQRYAEFLKNHPDSTLRAEVIWRQAQARQGMKNYDGVVKLLSANLAAAGPLADEYHFLMGEAEYEAGKFTEAAQQYGIILEQFPASQERLTAAVNEAAAWFQLKNWAAITKRLGAADGDFQRAVKNHAGEEIVVRGLLLLGEALMEQKQYDGVTQVLGQLNKITLTPLQTWKQLYLQTRMQRFAGRLDESAQSAVKLVVQSKSLNDRGALAQSILLEAEVEEARDHVGEAILIYQQNITPETPADLRRESLLKTVTLSAGVGHVDDAAKWLEIALEKYPRDPAVDLMRVTMGELRLKQYYALGASGTAEQRKLLLEQVRTQFDLILNDPTAPAWAGRAALGRGWYDWESGKTNEALADFKLAAEKLPVSADRAIALFKWADVQFQGGDFAGAAANYQGVIALGEQVGNVKDGLVSQALHQLVRTATRLGDAATAATALKRILKDYPETFFAQQDLLLAGQALNQAGQPAAARELFDDFIKRFPDSELVPEVNLAKARTFVSEQKWTEAIGVYDDWVKQHAEHPFLPQAEFDLGKLYYWAGRDTNALAVYSQFVTQFPTNALAPRAQYWIADYHFRRSEFVEAERNYQQIFQNTNWPATDLTYQARLDAGRAAFARSSFGDAHGYFTNLINDAAAPKDLVNQAMFAHGDTFIEEGKTDPVASLNKYADAISAFNAVALAYANTSSSRSYATNLLGVLAYGRMGDCNVQLASLGQDAVRYQNAIESYRRVIESDLADVSIRSQARFKLASVYEMQARATKVMEEQTAKLKQAINVLLEVVLPDLKEGEIADPFWLQKSGLAAGRLLEEQQRWQEAATVYARLMEWLPSLRADLQKRLDQLPKQSAD